jgi:CLIP-associating protein 1/2
VPSDQGHLLSLTNPQVLEATNTIRDSLTAKVEPVFGLGTMHNSLRTFLDLPLPAGATEEVKSASQAFGLIALGKFTLRLPAEVAEDEIPRMKGMLISVSGLY